MPHHLVFAAPYMIQSRVIYLLMTTVSTQQFVLGKDERIGKVENIHFYNLLKVLMPLA